MKNEYIYIYVYVYMYIYIFKYVYLCIDIIPSPYYSIPPKCAKLGSISNFGKFVVGQFDFYLIPFKNQIKKAKLLFVGFPHQY